MRFRKHLKELGYKIVGTFIGVGLIAGVAFLGHFLNIEFLQSQAGVFISTIVLMEVFFFSAIVYAVATGKF